MTHSMNLIKSAFDLILSGRKTVEMRLYDEKRQKLVVGDNITFSCVGDGRSFTAVVTRLTRHKDFCDLYSHYTAREIGYLEGEISNPDDMLKYYTAENIKKYGALAISVKVLQ